MPEIKKPWLVWYASDNGNTATVIWSEQLPSDKMVNDSLKIDDEDETIETISADLITLGKPYDAAPELLSIAQRLLQWEQDTGGWEAPVWHELRKIVANAIT